MMTCLDSVGSTDILRSFQNYTNDSKDNVLLDFETVMNNLKEHNPQAALNYLSQSLEGDLFHADTYNNLGIAYLQLRDPHRAFQAFHMTLKIDPHYATARANLEQLQTYLEHTPK